MNHIKATHEENKAWCGKTLTTDFYFKDAEHAAINGITQGRLIPCVDCVEMVMKYMGAAYDEI